MLEQTQSCFSKATGLLCDRNQLSAFGVDNLAHVPVPTTTLNSFITKPKEKQFVPLDPLPNVSQLNTLVTLVLGESVRSCMSHHYYSIGGQIKRQTDGGAIGVDLKNEVSCLYMLRWDRSYRNKLNKLGINIILYKRYVEYYHHTEWY